MDAEENILLAIYINLINNVMNYLPTSRSALSFIQEIIASKKEMYEIFLLLKANDKYKVVKRKSFSGYDNS